MRTTIAWIAILSLALFGCTKKADVEGERAAITKADADWSTAIGSKDPTAFVSFVDANGTIMPPNSPAVTGTDAITAWSTQMFAMPGFGVSWTAMTTEVAASGDLGYTTGSYQFQGSMPDGTPMTDHGKYATIWRKQTDGSWKVVVDIFNSDVEMPMPSSAPSDTAGTTGQ